MTMFIKSRLNFLQLLAITFLLLSSCRDNGNPTDGKPPCGGIDPGIVPEPAYDSPIWHPSGQFIGFNHTPLVSITYPYGEGCWGNQHFNRDSAGFWLINPDGTNMHRIFPYKLQSPAWSPDGNWIAFCVPFGDGVQIFKMQFTGATFDTNTVTQLTTTGRNFFHAWSPDGQWIAYDRSLADESGPAGIWRMKFDGSSKQALFGGAFPAWNPSGNILIGVIGISSVTAGTRFILYDVAHTKSTDTLLAVGNDNRNPRYSPTGTRIAFWANGNIWQMDSLGNNKEQLTTSEVDVSFGLPFSWSPDGNKIIYTRYQSTDWTMNNGVFWLIDVNTKTEKQLTSNP